MAPRKSPTSRRRFLGLALGVGPLGLAAPGLLAACGAEREGPDCMLAPGLTATQRVQRSALGYLDRTGDAARRCDVCAFYTKPPGAGACGGCTLVPGPVNPAGTCNSFAPES